MRIYDVELESLQAQVGQSKQEWTEFWDMFSETVILETWNEDTQRMSNKTTSRLKADLSAVDNWCATKVHRIAMLPQVSQIPIAKERTKVTHVVPPVAPIYIPRNVKLQFTEQVNTDVKKKHLAAFVDGANDKECIRAARKMLHKLTDKSRTSTKPNAKPKPKPKQTTTAKAKAADASSSTHEMKGGKKKTQKQKDNETQARLSNEQTAILNQMKQDEPGLLSEAELKTTESTHIEFKVKEACIGVKGHVDLTATELIYGLEWDPTVLEERESKIMWQPTSRAFENDDDFIEALNETWTDNRAGASPVERQDT